MVRNIITTVDDAQLPILRGAGDGSERVAIGDPVPATSVGRVVSSADPAVPVGTQVKTSTGWQTFATTTIRPDQIADSRLGSPVDWVSVLDTPGVIAYLGLHDIGGVRAGATVLVTEGASATGVAAVQLAVAAGARVVAMVGGPSRARRAAEVLGADGVVDYCAPAFPRLLRAAVEEGVDLLLDNSGDQQLQLALSVIKDHGSIVLCAPNSGLVRPEDLHPSAEAALGVINQVKLRGNVFAQHLGGRLHPLHVDLRATMRSHAVSDDYADRLPEIRTHLAQLVAAKSLRAVVCESVGLDRAPAALAASAGMGAPLSGRRVVWLSEAERSQGRVACARLSAPACGRARRSLRVTCGRRP